MNILRNVTSPVSAIKHAVRRMCTKDTTISFPLRFNQLNILMISPTLQKQLFRFDPHQVDDTRIKKSLKSLVINNLLRKGKEHMENYNFPLPKLLGPTLEEHFHILGYEFCIQYIHLACRITEGELPIRPKKMVVRPGWIRYISDDKFEPVEYPDCDVLIFDVETSVQNRSIPVMAVAVSDRYWYCWMSEHLFTDRSYEIFNGLPKEVKLKEMIPLGPSDSRPRLVVGHNVCFDRSYIREEYSMRPNFMYFMDTMSMHILLRGFADSQRLLVGQKAGGTKSRHKESWRSQSCFNSLASLSKFYLGKDLDKSPVDVFIRNDLNVIFEQAAKQMDYCIKDVSATRQIFKVMMSEYFMHAPHPITLSGMLIMSKCYIPINESWSGYINSAQSMFMHYESEMDRIITLLAQQHVSEGLQSNTWVHDPWLKHLDWSLCGYPDTPFTDAIKTERTRPQTGGKRLASKIVKEARRINDYELLEQVTRGMKWFPDLPENLNQLYRRDIMAGYPVWFKKLINHRILEDLNGPRPSDINHSHRIVPLILKLSWNGHPVFYHDLFQWGYLLPKLLLDEQKIDALGLPLDGKKGMPFTIKKLNYSVSSDDNDIGMKYFWEEESLSDDLADQDFINERLFGIYANAEFADHVKTAASKESYYQYYSRGLKVYDNIVPDYYYVPIPHPDGLNKLCGNPLGNDYAKNINDGHLIPMTGEIGMRFIHLLQSTTFWKNNRDRITNQLVVYFEPHELPPEYTGNNLTLGAIVPGIVPAGTITRRAVEKTWLTAVNPQIDMIGSELKSGITAPDGFCFVGADVDSEEMWIASLIADAAVVGIHGATPFSYMNIQGSRSRGTDIHTVTANAIGIDRNDAKILNYGRLYGAGVTFAKSMIKRCQPHLTENEATVKAIYLYNFTKGIKCVELTEKGKELAKKYLRIDEELITLQNFYTLMKKAGVKKNTGIYGKAYHQGGSESEIFNVLDAFTRELASSTPILDVCIPRTLARRFARDDFISSRMNWVVQSSAVDFLHMLLLTCYWLFSLLKVPARLVICIHDEIRFMVPEDKRYEAAICLHVANLFTRSAFSQRLGIHDLPQSVAFFSGVDIDKVLRKDPSGQCVTPSNPEKIGSKFNTFKCEILNIRSTLQKVGYDIFTEERLKNIKEYLFV